MTEGFILDRGDYNSRNLQSWIAGAPVKSFWHGFHINDRHKYAVTTWRCDRCGYLESFARTPAN
jgi:hypothetical protein